MRIVAQTGIPAPQGIAGCSNEEHLWWRNARPGDRLVLAFPVAASGKYRVFGRFVKARDYGVLRLSIDDRETGAPLDFYNDGVIVSDEILLGTFNLTAGEHQFAAEIVGANERALKQYMFGLDYLRLEKAE